MYNKLILVDYSWMLARYFYAMQHDIMHDPEKGEVFTGSIRGFTMFTQSVLTHYPDSLIIFCQDGSAIERKKMNERYKANRDLTDEKKEEKKRIHASTAHIVDVLSNCKDVFFAKVDDKEGDDVIALLAAMSLEKNPSTEITIYSGDKDFWQLLSVGAKVANELKKNKFVYVTENDVFTKFGVGLDQLLHLRVLLGDKSDNISPPVKFMKEVAKKRFVELWQGKTLSETLDAYELEDPNWGKKLKDNQDIIEENLDLMDLLKYQQKENRFEVKMRRKPITDLSLMNYYGLIEFRHFLRGKYGI